MKTRAVARFIEPGEMATCVFCHEYLKFRAASRAVKVIANIYKKSVWQSVEQFHRGCYDDAGQPYGPVDPPAPRTRGKTTVSTVVE